MEKTKEIVVLEKQASTIISSANSAVVINDNDMMQAAKFRSDVKALAKSIKEEKEKATQPLNGLLKLVRGWFAPMEENCDSCISIIESKMNQYQVIVEKKRIEEERKAQKAIDEANKKLEEGKITEKQAEKLMVKAEEKLEKAPEVITKSADFHTRVDKKVRFTPVEQLPPKELEKLAKSGYLVWDAVKVRKDVLAGIEIVGTEIYLEKSFI